MDDAYPDVPETHIDNEIAADVDTHVSVEPTDGTVDTDIEITTAPPNEPPLESGGSPVEVEPESPLPSMGEKEVTSDVTQEQEAVIVASDVTPTESPAAKEVKTEVQRQPDTRPKRRLGWRAYILGGSGGTK